jgi:vacuolar-type H+-ATPase subunit B/Vma2
VCKFCRVGEFPCICQFSNKIAQSLDLKNNKISNAILNKFFINEWNKNKEKFSDGKLSTYITVKNNFDQHLSMDFDQAWYILRP